MATDATSTIMFSIFYFVFSLGEEIINENYSTKTPNTICRFCLSVKRICRRWDIPRGTADLQRLDWQRRNKFFPLPHEENSRKSRPTVNPAIRLLAGVQLFLLHGRRFLLPVRLPGGEPTPPQPAGGVGVAALALPVPGLVLGPE